MPPCRHWRPFLNALHPAGVAPRIRGIGGRARGWEVAGPDSDGEPGADLILIAPTRIECLTPGWLARAIGQAADALPAEGIVHVLVPWLQRRRAVRLLGRHGFRTAPPIGHFLGAGTACHVPLAPAPLLYALENLPIRRARLLLVAAKALLAVGGPGLLGLLPPIMGLPAYRRRAPPFAWLTDRDAGGTSALVLTNLHSPGSSATVLCFPEGARVPAAVAKVSKVGMDEASRLIRLGPAAAAAGIRVPRAIRRFKRDGNVTFIETAVPGRPAVLLLRRRPERFPAVVDELAGWLARWSRATLMTTQLTRERREAEILLPAESLIDELPRGADYLEWIARRSRELLGRPLPWVAAHNDLTMSNLLVDNQDGLGVVDWNGAQPDGLPLTDFWYAVCDALSAARGHADRDAAFLDCFVAQGRYSLMIARHEVRLREIVGQADGWIELCFHACWLQHAMNERLRGSPGTARPFLAIARRLAQDFDRGL